MAKVWERKWTTAKGEAKSAWVADYFDADDKRHIATFKRKKEAVEYLETVRSEVRKGVHTAPHKSITVAEAADGWLKYVTLEKREAATIAGYRQHVDKHINPRIGRNVLATLTTPRIQAFRDALLQDMSRALGKKVLTSLKAIIKDAKRRGHVAQNVAADVSITIDERDRPRLEIGRDIPTRDEIRRMIDAAPEGRSRALLMTDAFTGLRASELRGLRWTDVEPLPRGNAQGELRVRQRADRYRKIGRPKSRAGERDLPIGPMVVNTLRAWKVACPKGDDDLVFPTGVGSIENHSNIVQRILEPAQLAAGITVPVLDANGKPRVDDDGKPMVAAKYGMHALRHFYASWCINRKQDGGLELLPKAVQARMGHSTIVITLDLYGHLFPSNDDGAELAAAERAIFASAE